MPILAGDIKLVASQVMDDVPEGGGAPTATVILDGASNAIFPDISELDRAGGRVNLRKLHISVQTPDTDTYLGSNIIVAEPPTDPNVSVTLFTTRQTFDRRESASTRIESYLNQGTSWSGYLLENHIAGQRVIQLFQRPETELPLIGQTLVLIQDEGLTTQKTQYIRTTKVVSVIRKFYDEESKTDYSAAVVTVFLSDALRTDFKGSPPSRKFTRTPSSTNTCDTTVADAGTYVGVSPLTAPSVIGDFTVQAKSLFTQLVPSAQTETPVADIRLNGLSTPLVPAGAAVTVTSTQAFSTTTSMFVGGPIYPATLSIVRSGVTLTDAGGRLMNGSDQVGTVDYDNGTVLLLSNIFGTGAGTHQVTFRPAAAVELLSDQRAILVTAETRSQNYTFTLTDIPVPRTVVLSYRAQGRWYVLRDDGSGTLLGSDSAFGSGRISYLTGNLLVTLGALPDVGSALLIQSYSKVSTTPLSTALITNNSKLYFPFNTSGAISEERGAKPITIGSLSVAWSLNGAAKMALDDGLGNLTGDATGTVDYSAGVIRVSPDIMPPYGTTFLMDMQRGDILITQNQPLVSGNTGRINIIPGSVSIPVNVLVYYEITGPSNGYVWKIAAGSAQTKTFYIFDKAGSLVFRDPANDTLHTVGTVNYAAGTYSVTSSLVPAGTFDVSGPVVTQGGVSWGGTWRETPYAWNDAPVTKRRFIRITSSNTSVNYATNFPGPDSISAIVNSYIGRVRMVPDYTLKGVGFTLGGVRFNQIVDGTLLSNQSTTTGIGVPSGSVYGPLGVFAVNFWAPNSSPIMSDAYGVLSPPTAGLRMPFMAISTVMRVAAAPLRVGSFSVLGTLQDGSTFNVTADSAGRINSPRVKGVVDYEFGLAQLYFVNVDGDVNQFHDLTHLGIPGLTTIPLDYARLDTLRYNAVSYSYLPLDASILGIDPVRLPSDGRVPIFRTGGFAVVGHTASITATVVNAQVINCARVRLSRVRVIGADGIVINTGYTADLEAGRVTFTNVSGYSQPIKVEHRIEDMSVVREVQINGEVSFTRPLTHNYPLGSYLSSALVAQDLKSRVSVFFDQGTWNGITWLDNIVGDPATGTYNDILSPVVVTNAGAVTERWALRFISSTAFQIIGEHVGVIGTGSINTLTAPINPATGQPYFVIPILGWGIGWSTGNVLRLNTVGAMFPVWVVRTVQQGAESVQDDSFSLLVRGDVDRP